MMLGALRAAAMSSVHRTAHYFLAESSHVCTMPWATCLFGANWQGPSPQTMGLVKMLIQISAILVWCLRRPSKHTQDRSGVSNLPYAIHCCIKMFLWCGPANAAADHSALSSIFMVIAFTVKIKVRHTSIMSFKQVFVSTHYVIKTDFIRQTDRCIA